MTATADAAIDLTAESIMALPTINTEMPGVDWEKLGVPPRLIPQLQPLPQQKTTDPLPQADMVVITWTAAEWMAMHQVLCAPPQTFTVVPGYNQPSTSDWRAPWIPYQFEFDQIRPYLQEMVKHKKGNCPSLLNNAWARIAMVRIGDLRVLLMKCDMHLAQDGPQVPLQQFVRKVCREAAPRLVLSIGTAGAVRRGDTLGSVLISNKGYFDLTTRADGKLLKEYAPEFAALNRTTVSSAWIPDNRYLAIAEQGFIPTSEPDVLPPTPAYEATVIKAVKTAPKALLVLDSPVITTDTFLFGSSDYALEKYGCIVEMDDAVVGDICGREGVPFGFVRNISDPVISQDLAVSLKSVWAAYIYQEFGLATSYNGALVTWGLIAAHADKDAQPDRIAWRRVAPAPLRDTLTVQPLAIAGDEPLQHAHAFVSWEQDFFISHPDGLMRLTYDAGQSRFSSRLLLKNASPYHTLSPFAVSDASATQLYLAAYQRDENRLDILRMEQDAATREFSAPFETGQDRFSVMHAYEGYRCNLLMAYGKETGDSRIYRLTRRDGGFDLDLLWQKKWAPGWENFCFFTMGKENFFFKTNSNPELKRRMVNIDHYMDTPGDGAHPVCTTLPETALDASAVAGIPLAEGPGLVFAHKNGISIQRIHSDCQGWHTQAENELVGTPRALYVLPGAKGESLLGFVV